MVERIKQIYKNDPAIIDKLIKFVFVGGTSTVINYSVFYILYKIFEIYYIVSSVTGFISGLIFGYIFNKIWTYKHEVNKDFGSGKVYIYRYLLVYMTSLVVGTLLLKFLVETSGLLSPMIANVFSIGLSTAINFTGTNFYVFKSSQNNVYADVNLIPMAGAGKRFSDQGYKLPKPLILVSGIPMILQACKSLPSAKKWIFICREEHIVNTNLQNLLTHQFPESKLIAINYLTEGQASSCILAKSELDPEKSLLIGPCDNGMTWNKMAYSKLCKDTTVDAIIWTFRNNTTVKRNPRMYGWVRTDENGKALEVSCKKPISENPVHDHAIVGTFYFAKSLYFTEAYQSMYAKNRRINNEFYVDELMNELIEIGKNVKVFEIEKYICWGTPDDLRVYEYWENYFLKGGREIH